MFNHFYAKYNFSISSAIEATESDILPTP